MHLRFKAELLTRESTAAALWRHPHNSQDQARCRLCSTIFGSDIARDHVVEVRGP
jgi:hypothetical protein